MNTKDRFKNLCITVFGVTITWAVLAHNHFGPQLQITFGAYYPYLFVLASLVSYDLILKGLIYAIDHLSVLKKIYWGSLYFEGLWSYTSRSKDIEFFGIWRIEQDIFETKVVAFGLDHEFRRRSTVKSVSDLLGEKGVFEIVNERWDLEVGVRKQFSRTVLVPDSPVRHHLLFRYPTVIRGETIIYGGAEDSFIASDLRMIRRDDCHTEDDLISKLKNERTTHPVTTELSSQAKTGIDSSALASGEDSSRKVVQKRQ
jgi:hypothetical protein